MKKNYGVFRVHLTALMIILAVSCASNKFKIKIAMPATVNAAYTISYYASDSKGGRMIETAVAVQQGKGEIELPGHNPALVYLSTGMRRIYFLARRGDKIEISGENADPYAWRVTGNDINTALSDWRNKNVGQLAGGDPAKINAAVAEYVKANPENPVSALLLLCDYDRRENNLEFLELWKSLQGEAAMEKWTELVSRNDMMENMPLSGFDGKGEMPLILKTRDNGVDTVYIGRQPTVVYVWRAGDSDRKRDIDSLKSLRREHPDSSAFMIVDICFDADSVTWIMPLRADSLSHTVRGWLPMAEADSAMRRIGAERTPQIITIPPVKKSHKSKK